MKLSVFEGGFTRAAAREVAEVGLEELMDLISTSFVTLEKSGRYGFHPLTKQYLEQKLIESDEVNEIKRQHALYFLSLAEKAEPKLKGEEQEVWLERLDKELDNIRGVLSWSISREEANKALKLAGSLKDFWTYRAYSKEGLQWMTQVLRITAEDNGSARVKALEAAGGIAEHLGKLEVSREYLEKGIKLDAKLSVEKRSISLRLGLGNVMLSLGNYEAARAYYQEGVELSMHVKSMRDTAKLLNNLGMLEEEQGHRRVAQTYYEKSLSILKELGDLYLTSVMLVNLALLHFNQGQNLRALRLYQKSLPLAMRLKNRHLIAIILNGLGAVEGAQGNLSAARAYYEASLKISKPSGIKSLIAMTLGNLGNIDRRRGSYMLAKEYLQEGLEVAHESGIIKTTLLNLEKYASLMYSTNKFSSAVQIWGSVSQVRQKIGQPLPYKEQQEHQEFLSTAREELGSETFEAIWEAGQKLTLDEVITYALN